MTPEHQKMLDEFALFQGWQVRQGLAFPHEVLQRLDELAHELESSEVH